MSLSNPKTSMNPAVKLIEWSGDKNTFKYYDKNAKVNVEIEEDIYIITLDQLSAIKGWSDKYQSGIWSNEVKYLDKQPLIVKTKSGTIATGLYSEIKEKLSSHFLYRLRVSIRYNSRCAPYAPLLHQCRPRVAG